MLEEMIQQYVFITNNKEKANIIMAREETKSKLIKLKEFISQEIEKIG